MYPPNDEQHECLCTNDSRAQMAFVICSHCMRWMALTCEATGQAHVHFTVDAGYKAVNFQIINAQSELVCLVLFHKIEFFECERLLILGFRHYPRLQSYFSLLFYNLTPTNAFTVSGSPST